MNIFGLFNLVGGLALFLYGMHIMGQALEKVSGGKLERILESLTKNRLMAVLLGTAVTGIIQSSSATTVMVVGFVNSGIMKLNQAIGIIMGANIGTTVTAWLLSLVSIEGTSFVMTMLKPSSFSPILAIIGVVMILFSKKEKKKIIGEIMIGFAILMFGMETMSSAVKPLADVPEFTNILVKFSNPILGILVGAGVTAIIQSSSASVGILQALCVTGVVSFRSAIPIIMGQNIGTCVTAIISSIGAARDAKRAAAVHLYFNLIGTIIFTTAFYSLNYILHFGFMDNVIAPAGIAVIHTTFNIVTTAILFPFGNQLEKLAILTIKDKKTLPDASKQELQMLDERFLDSSGYAIMLCKNAAAEMAGLAKKAVYEAIALVSNYDEERARELYKIEDEVDRYEDKLGSYLVKVSSKNLSIDESHTVSMLLHSLNDFERISDHAINILDSAKELYDKGLVFSQRGSREVEIYSNAVKEILDITIRAFENMNKDTAMMVEPLEDVIDDINIVIKEKHIKRLRSGECTMELGFILSDISTNYERVADHCSNLAIYVLQSDMEEMDTHNFLLQHGMEDSKEFQSHYIEYKEKYHID
ncbi:MAG: Na/Pi cotransporter family protein [Candidatus Metalachnospira sp.]|nr:Na/Pi cotransporter family protein [Candidatus Metalachnospira sp.]